MLSEYSKLQKHTYREVYTKFKNMSNIVILFWDISMLYKAVNTCMVMTNTKNRNSDSFRRREGNGIREGICNVLSLKLDSG